MTSEDDTVCSYCEKLPAVCLGYEEWSGLYCPKRAACADCCAKHYDCWRIKDDVEDNGLDEGGDRMSAVKLISADFVLKNLEDILDSIEKRPGMWGGLEAVGCQYTLVLELCLEIKLELHGHDRSEARPIVRKALGEVAIGLPGGGAIPLWFRLEEAGKQDEIVSYLVRVREIATANLTDRRRLS